MHPLHPIGMHGMQGRVRRSMHLSSGTGLGLHCKAMHGPRPLVGRGWPSNPREAYGMQGRAGAVHCLAMQPQGRFAERALFQARFAKRHRPCTPAAVRARSQGRTPL